MTIRPFPAPRPSILATAQAYHGALDYVELEQGGIAPQDVLDFSVNSNPFGPSPHVIEVVRNVALDRYPDREALALRRALANHLAVSPDQIMIGNGTAELIHLLAVVYVQPGDRVVIIGPTFGEYARAAQLLGATVTESTAQAQTGFAIDPAAVSNLIEKSQPRLVFICRPNNPTGVVLPLPVLDGWAAAAPETLFVVDEAYLAFAAPATSALALGQPNIVLLRSMTKDYALAGLRLGYAVGHPQVVAALAQTRPAWNTNALAQAAGVAALADQAYLQHTLVLLGQAKADLVAGLARLGLQPLPSDVHFFLVEVGDGAGFRRALLRQGILVRDCASFGLSAHVRIAPRRPVENERLLAAISALDLPNPKGL